MSLLVAAGLLAALSVVLLGPFSKWLSQAAWVSQAPRAAVLCWQCIGLGAISAGIGAGLSVAVARYRVGFAGGVRELVGSLFSGHPLQGLGLYDALALTLAADLGIVLVVIFSALMTRTVRSRARHRRLLDLVAHQSAAYPGTDLISDSRTVAYCVPGVRPRIVLSEGTLRLLGPTEIAAVIEHERGHVHERHGLVMLPMLGLKNLFRWIPYARLAPREIATLLEMSADDYSARRYRPADTCWGTRRHGGVWVRPTVCALGRWLGCAPKSQPAALVFTELQEDCRGLWASGGCDSCSASGSCGALGMKGPYLVVDRSTTGLNSGESGGRSVDGRPVQRTGLDALDEFKHLAKVRVAGSNPVFRSKELPVQLAGLENRSIDGVLAGIRTEQ